MSIYAYGKNTVREAVKSKKATALLVLQKNAGDEIVSLAKANGIPVKFVPYGELDSLSNRGNHQGFVCACPDYKTYSLEDIISSAKEKQYPLVLMIDGLEDPHNLGAILRSADAFGVDGIVMKKHGEVQLTPTVAKVSTGAIDYVKVSVVSNLSQAIEKFKAAGYWVVSSDGEAKITYDKVDYKCPILLIIGSEGFGISKLVLKNSDFIVKIPMVGHVNSLNASVATGILVAGIDLLRNK